MKKKKNAKRRGKKASAKKAKKGRRAAKGRARTKTKGKAKPKKPLTKFEKSLKAHASEIDELVERGRPRGFVTDNEILYYFPKIEDSVELLDEIYDRLEKAGIKVIETSALIDFSKDENDKNIDDSLAFEGDVPDAVQMYLKEIGRRRYLRRMKSASLRSARRGATKMRGRN